MPVPVVGSKRCGLMLEWKMLQWTCPVHGHANYAQATFRFEPCSQCDGSGEVADEGRIDDCPKCYGTGGKRFCAEEI